MPEHLEGYSVPSWSFLAGLWLDVLAISYWPHLLDNIYIVIQAAVNKKGITSYSFNVWSGHEYGRCCRRGQKPPLWIHLTLSRSGERQVPHRTWESFSSAEHHWHPWDIRIHSDLFQWGRARQTFRSGPGLLQKNTSKGWVLSTCWNIDANTYNILIVSVYKPSVGFFYSTDLIVCLNINTYAGYKF